MQTNLFNFLKKILLIVVFFTQVPDSQAQRKNNLLADSLFKQRNFEISQQKYKDILAKSQNINPNVFLKLAFIDENNAKFPEALYYLNMYFNRLPDERVFDKMNRIAEENNYRGYEKNDLNFIILLYRKYSNYLLGGFLLLGLYIFGILLYKKIKHQETQRRHKIILLFYLVLLFLLINLPNTYKSVIVKNANAYMRDYPSAAAPIVTKIGEGHKLNVLKTDDIWYNVLWEGKMVYIKATDVWLLN